MHTVLILMLISTILPVSIANAAFLEDYADTPTKKSLNTILDFCKSNPDGSIATELVNTSKISDFYAEYTCDDAASGKILVRWKSIQYYKNNNITLNDN